MENIHRNTLTRLSWEADPLLHFEATVLQVLAIIRYDHKSNIFPPIEDQKRTHQIEEPKGGRLVPLSVACLV